MSVDIWVPVSVCRIVDTERDMSAGQKDRGYRRYFEALPVGHLIFGDLEKTLEATRFETLELQRDSTKLRV